MANIRKMQMVCTNCGNVRFDGGQEVQATDDRFRGKTFVLTGTLPGLNRDEASAIILSHGGKAQMKDEIRKRIGNMRSQLTKPEDSVAGERVLRNILACPALESMFSADSVIGLYAPIRMEVDLLSHIGLLRERGCRIALPCIRQGNIDFSILPEACKLVSGCFGIMEPPLNAPCIPIEELRVICVPGIAFDRTGARIGYGKGFYDQFFHIASTDKRPVYIGIGYDFQMLDVIPQEKNDRKMDYIATPSGVTAVRYAI